MKTKQKNIIKRFVDVLLSVLLLFLMAYQVTGENLHEWLGIGMTALVILHQVLNAKWYGALLKGKYHAFRILQTAVNVLLLLSFAMTALCGMAMSAHAVPFLYGMLPVSFARQMHLSLSHWAFVLMGLHLGLHLPLMFAKLSEKKQKAITVVFGIIAAVGLFFFLQNGLYRYLFFKAAFAFYDFEKAAVLVFAENLFILLFFSFLGMQAATVCRYAPKRDERKKSVFSLIVLLLAVIVGCVLFACGVV